MTERKRNLRKKPKPEADVADDEVEDETDVSLLDRIHGTKAVQQHRSQRPGMTAEDLAKGEDDDFQMQSNGGDVEEGVVQGYVKARASSQLDVSRQMEQFIANELAARMGKRAIDEAEPDPFAAKRAREEAELYTIPDELKAEGTRDVVIPGFNTVITEVTLPSEYKLRNIEETEAAKKKLLDSSGSQAAANAQQNGADGTAASGRVPRGMFAATFGKHQPKRRTEMDEPVIHIKAPRKSSQRPKQ